VKAYSYEQQLPPVSDAPEYEGIGRRVGKENKERRCDTWEWQSIRQNRKHLRYAHMRHKRPNAVLSGRAAAGKW
jgi:hypothetical protein